MAEMEEDIPDPLPVEEDEELERDEEEGEFDWVVDEADELDDEDVVPAERSGHIAAVDGHYMYVWGGYKNSQTTGFFDLYLPRNEIWIYNMETERWKKQMTVGNLHTSMSGSCGVCVDGVLYLFGGHHARGNTDRVFRLPLRTPALCWEEMKDLKGLAPSCKDKLGCWVHKNRLVFFGGYGYMAQGAHRGTFEYDETSFMGDNPGRGWNNHIHILDLEKSTWSQPVTKGNAPSPRAAHACAKVGNRGYVFGGRYRDYRLNDMYYIDMDSWEWHEMYAMATYPFFYGRMLCSYPWMSLCSPWLDHNEFLYLFVMYTGDAWLYCVSKNEWQQFKHNHTESPRLWHTACSGPGGEVFVFGGCANNLLSHQRAAHSKELLVFTVQPKSLVRFCMEAALQHRELLSGSWDCLPKHLLHTLRQRMGGINALGS
uniref:Kelch domain containing 2 n=1 Tax=Oncorhynchus kisutch TaxID=8019 RepID=A0A8C7FLC8_ONCKI